MKEDQFIDKRILRQARILDEDEPINEGTKLIQEWYGPDIDIQNAKLIPGGMVLRNKRMVVPPDDKSIPGIMKRTEIYQLYHDSVMAGHPGLEKTLDGIKRLYWWPNMRQDIKEYVETCEVCQRTKHRRGKTQPPLQPLAIPTRPWEWITMDFITGLPESQGKTAILVVVDRFSKMGIFIPCVNETNSQNLAEMLLEHVFTKFGLPNKVTSDRGPQFVSKFTKDIYQALGIENATSTAYHPQTDSQTERVNQELEQYLRCYTSQVQDDWAKYVSLAEFAYNNRKHSATGKSPFEIILGYHPAIEPMGITEKVEINEHVTKIWNTQHEAYNALLKSQSQMARYANKYRGKEPEFKLGDRVLLDARNYEITKKS